ncbi:sigma-70 family RNA polymerase sigma factor [Macrococcoides caseolyticum]|uniref:sigma-70 family RNA polymerase sigma factor n=1 Tax=Macrococcoides caseolyticum TaxID=69966 RepID=UPI001F28AF62|nr:sigma-70 family RNA polymerase sigma factor [Macrococcus caseolyticus]MCE4955697.1 sigma-70 family RNA polymerase sigma factor [Macrococcus caseolyticus]
MFEQVKAEYEQLIYHFIHKYHLTYEMDEYYQLALIKLWELDHLYDPTKTKNKSQYMYTKMNFFFIDEIRKLAKRTERFVVTQDECLQLHATDDDYNLLLQDAKSILNDKEYTWFVLAVSGYQMKEIADLMQLSVSAVKGYKRKAKLKLSPYFQNDDI